MLRLSEDQLKRAPSSGANNVSMNDHEEQVKSVADAASEAIAELTDQATRKVGYLQQD